MAGGRPTKLTPEVRDRILQSVSVGVPFEAAAGSAGITAQTIRNWMKKGEEEADGEFREFLVAVKEAEGRALTKWMAIIDKAAMDGNWTAAAWKAERRYPQHFGRHRVEVTGKDGGPIEERVRMDGGLITDPERQAKILQILIEAGALEIPVKRGGKPDAPGK